MRIWDSVSGSVSKKKKTKYKIRKYSKSPLDTKKTWKSYKTPQCGYGLWFRFGFLVLVFPQKLKKQTTKLAK